VSLRQFALAQRPFPNPLVQPSPLAFPVPVQFARPRPLAFESGPLNVVLVVAPLKVVLVVAPLVIPVRAPGVDCGADDRRYAVADAIRVGVRSLAEVRAAWGS